MTDAKGVWGLEFHSRYGEDSLEPEERADGASS